MAINLSFVCEVKNNILHILLSPYQLQNLSLPPSDPLNHYFSIELVLNSEQKTSTENRIQIPLHQAKVIFHCVSDLEHK